MKPIFKILLIFIVFNIFSTNKTTAQDVLSEKKQVEWKISKLLKKSKSDIKVVGNPQLICIKFGSAVLFNGVNDGIFLNRMPLKGLTQFTVEAIIRPDSAGNFEQRFFHCGEVSESRVMLELRSTTKGWYFDAYLNSHGAKKTLIDSTKIHPSNKWYHVAYVVDNGRLTTYINKVKELQDSIPMKPFYEGRTSIGVRQNELSWFKGAIYKIKITPLALTPNLFKLK